MDYQSTDDARRADATIETPDALGRDFFTISDLSNEFDVTARAHCAFYEDQGLIAPQRQGLSRMSIQGVIAPGWHGFCAQKGWGSASPKSAR